MTSAKDLDPRGYGFNPTEEEMDPPGYGFNPTEEEIANDCLPPKISGNHSQASAIAEIDNICKYGPEDLRSMAKKPSSKHQWFFFSPRDSGRCTRRTKAGFWKPTGKKRVIKNEANQVIIKRYLVYYEYRGRKAVRTNWIIHEYYLEPSYSNERGYVMCRLFQKSPKKIVNSAVDEGESGHDSASAVENPVTVIASPEIEPQSMEERSNSGEQDFTSPTEQQPQMHICQGPSSFVNLQGTNGTIDYYTERLSPFGISVQKDNNTESLGTPHMGYVSCPEAVNATVDQCLPEMHMVQGLSNDNFQLTNSTIDYYTELLSPFGISVQQDNTTESFGTPHIGYVSYPEPEKAMVDQNLPDMHTVQGLSHVNFQQTNDTIDEYNFPWSQSGACGMQDNISEWEKSCPAVPDVTTYCRSTNTAPSDCNPLESLGSLHVENFSDTDVVCSLFNDSTETAPGVESVGFGIGNSYMLLHIFPRHQNREK